MAVCVFFNQLNKYPAHKHQAHVIFGSHKSEASAPDVQARQKCAGTLFAAGYCKRAFICLPSFFIFSSKTTLNILLVRSTLRCLLTQNYFQGIAKDVFERFQVLRGSHFEGNPIRILLESPVPIKVNELLPFASILEV